ncbi:MAG: integrase core domain-containing protein, partial [Rhodococcus sp. (in: high G+C Gram-positive bacteria)]
PSSKRSPPPSPPTKNDSVASPRDTDEPFIPPEAEQHPLLAGQAYDNALAESANGLYKTECIRTTIFHSGPYKTISDVEFATAGWVDWYNHIHHSLGVVSGTV